MNEPRPAGGRVPLPEQERFWRDRLVPGPGPLRLTLDAPRPPAPAYLRRRASRQLDTAAAASLGRACAELGVTPFDAVHTALRIALLRYSGQADLVVGSLSADSRRETEGGEEQSYLNPIALRAALDPDMTLAAALERVASSAREAGRHRDYPFERLNRDLSRKGGRSGEPIFQVMLVCLDVPWGVSEAAISQGDLAAVAELQVASDLFLLVSRAEGALRITCEYDAEILSEPTIATLLEHLRLILERFPTEPGSRLSELPPATDPERHAVTVEWNRTAADFPRVAMHRLIERQAQATPDLPAVEAGTVTWSYAELNRRANRWARGLQRRGVGPGTRVGIFLDHSPELVAAVLAVLKTGAAYVPLDPEHPRGRVAFVLSDAGVAAVLTRSSLADRLPKDGPGAIRVDDAGWDQAADAAADAADPPLAAAPEDLAYILYTSGSTGEPKGVAIRHASLVNYVWWARDVYLRGEPLSFALHSSLAFDLTVTSLFTPLIAGTRVVIHPATGGQPPLDAILDDPRVGVLKLTPSHLKLIEDRDNSGSAVRCLIVGGEALESSLARRVLESFGGRVEIFNEYGPTEATVGCMIHRFDPARDRRVAVPIGRPAANAQIHLLDAAMNPVPALVIGDLYISGEGLARDYLNRPELTRERFVEAQSRPGARLYRSGDLARRLPSGDLEFIGRADEQVQFHGFRVEPNEIRCALNRHGEIRDSVVLVRSDSNGNDLLVAYYVSRRELSGASLREFLLDSVLRETIPNLFVHLKRLPLTVNGKINYDALPAVVEARRSLARSDESPRTPIEESVARIWREVLGVDRIGPHDGFFEMGGHSLLATQVISRVRGEFGIELPLRVLFESPQMEAFARGLEAGLLGARAEAGPGLPALEPIPREGRLALSFAQRRLWFLDRWEPGSVTYNVAAAWWLTGDLDLDVLRRCLDEVVGRHEVLRTVFAVRDGEPEQNIVPAGPADLTLVDLRGIPEAEQIPQCARAVEAAARRPFDLAAGPLFRALLVRLAGGRHRLLLGMHHIVSDGWSMGILFEEISELYEAHVSGRDPRLAALPVQYADFAAWQRRWLVGRSLDSRLAWWKERLSGELPAVQLHADHPRPPVRGAAGRVETGAVEPAVAEKLQALARSEGVTLFMLLLAAFQTLLGRHTGQDDIIVGTPIANRNRKETERLVGFFVNTLALRTDLSGDPIFRELLARVREMALGAYAHQDLPFEKLVEELHPRRDLSRTPLFQVVMVLQNMPRQALHLPGVEVGVAEEVSTGTAKFDLTLAMTESAEGLTEVWEYATDLFEADSIRRLRDHYHALLSEIARNPERRLSEFPVLTAGERERIVNGWNATRTDYPRESGVHELFEAVAARTPGAPAVLEGTERLTYGQLDRRANQLAHHLCGMGVGPEVRVGLCLGRSIDLVVAMLGVLKAGGAYVPLDPGYPAERIRFMLEDTGAPIVVTMERWRSGLPLAAYRIVSLDGESETLGRLPAEQPGGGASAEQLAYIIYTSGSTGRPKGIGVPHRAINRLVLGADYVQLEPRDRVAHASNTSFDAATFEVWGPLLNGASLVVVPQDVLMSPPAYASLLRSQGITTLFVTTALFNQLALECPGIYGTLRHVLFGGEAVDPRVVRAVLAGAPPTRLLHVYGPTESTTFASWHLVTEVPEDAETVAIGRPIANTRLHVLDGRMEPVPIGAPGEIYIGGDGLAHGYPGRPDLTAERFVPDPFGAAGSRLYRTGDLARYRANGDIEFLKRVDRQVKVRGFRIEPGEIESVLLEHPQIREAVVEPLEESAGERRLVAYVVGKGETPPAIGDVRRHLQGRLPGYMVPSAFVVLPALPLNPNGKVDRAALPPPGESRPELEEQWAPSRTPAEATLTAIWADVLGVSRVGIHDNFFELGGDSILSIRIISRARAAGLHLTPRQLFQHQTVAELAAVAEPGPEPEADSGPVSGSAPLTPIQHWFLALELPQPARFSQVVVAKVRERLDPADWSRVMALLIECHDALRLRLVREGGRWSQEFAGLDAIPALEVVRGPSSTGAGAAGGADSTNEVREVAARLLERLDLERGPLFRAALLVPDGGRADQLVLAAHHLVIDGVSWRILLQDMEALCALARRGEALQLPARTTSGRAWAEGLRAYARSPELAAERGLWRGFLDSPASPLPVDHPGGVNAMASARSLTVTLDLAEPGTALEPLGRLPGARVRDLLLASLVWTLSRWSGSPSLLVDLEGHGREDVLGGIDLSRTLGWFTSIYPVRFECGGLADAADALRVVTERQAAIPHHGIGWGILRYLSDDHAWLEFCRAAPSPEVGFNYLGQFEPAGGSLAVDWAEAFEAATLSTEGRRFHLLDVDALIAGNRLQVCWTWSESLHRRETIEGLAESFAHALRELAVRGRVADQKGYTPSDFPLARLSTEQLANVLARARRRTEGDPN